MSQRKKRLLPEPSTLIATVEAVKRSYFISEVRDYERVDDEAIIEVRGRIEHISGAPQKASWPTDRYDVRVRSVVPSH